MPALAPVAGGAKASSGAGVQRRARTAYLLLLPGIAWLGLFFVVPLVSLFFTSLQSPTGTPGVYQPGFEIANYVTAISDYWPQFIKSFIYSGIATVLALVIAYPLAYFIAFKAGKWRALLLVLVVAPFFASFLLRTYAWRTILADEGFITSFLNALHLLPEGRI
ncbi:MAG: ABC transporter permease, partial [Actinomycetota bacterium]